MTDELLQVCEVTVSYQPKVKATDKYIIRGAEDVHRLMVKQVYSKATIEYKEYVKVVLLNRTSRVLGVAHIADGGVNSAGVDVKIVMQIALLAHASAIILVHNHPSGDITPSNHDDTLTRRIQQAAKLLEIDVYDHVIITAERFYSYASEGRL